MKIKRFLTFIISLLLVGTLLLSQNLVEVAKKEKERRAKLKGKKAEVVTNQNLYKYRRKEAIVTKSSSFIPRLPQISSPPPRKAYKSKEIPSSTEIDKREMFWKGRKAEYEERLKKAKEYVELLTLKMNGLWQEFYSMDDMTSRDKIQQEISETYQKLLKAKEEEARLKKELEEFLSEARKQGALPGWLREKD